MHDPYNVMYDLLSYNSYSLILQILNEVNESMHYRAVNNYNEMKQIQDSGAFPETAKEIEIKAVTSEPANDVAVTKEPAKEKKIMRKPRKSKITV
jgi:hypothetical protein